MAEAGNGETGSSTDLKSLLTGVRTEQEAEARMERAGVAIPDEWMDPLYRASMIQTGATGVVSEANVANTTLAYTGRVGDGSEQDARAIAFKRNVTGSGIPPTPSVPAQHVSQASNGVPKK